MNYDFKLRSRKGFLKLDGPLTEPDSEELKQVLMGSLEKCHSLELNIDDITALSTSCVKTLALVTGVARKSRKALIIGTHYHQDAMSQWIREKIATV
ncbi:MAG: hypothetical protein GY940_36975 [bacterium]|nr:hypothetical protein [bacterium]